MPDLFNGDYDAFLFDMDGVLTDTASVHGAAWKQAFDSFLERRDGSGYKPFDITSDYQHYVDGKPRDKGVADFLASRGITLPHGTPTDAPGDETVWAVGNAKNVIVVSLIKAGKVEKFDDTIELVRKLRAANLKCAVVSSSANTESILKAVDIEDLFQARVDGNTIIEQGLPGKPAPDTFILGAKLLGSTPDRSVVFEDAIAGVAAGKAGDFALVIGVDRVNHAQALLDNGATIALSDLTQLIPPTTPNK